MRQKSPDSAITIDYYTDVLCVWAWIAQVRLEEVHRQWGERISIRHRYVDIFGDCHRKIPGQWGEADGFEKFGAHVADSAARFEHCQVNPAIWSETRPRSSMQAHLVLKAVEVLAGQKAVEAAALRIRRAFFVDAQDVSDLTLLLELAAQEGVDRESLADTLRDGRASAELSTDLRAAADQGVKGSPTWVLNEGRQLLYGNVGYRILSANIEELLKHPDAEASWC
jgi:predicted DsbA family dithiol-disulfide isomerase